MCFTYRRVPPRCAQWRSLYGLPTRLFPLRRNRTTTTAAAGATAKLKLTSPSAPLNHVFELLPTPSTSSSSSTTPEGVVLHTGYAALPAANEPVRDVSRSCGAGTSDVCAKTNHPTETPSYAVTDMAAFERLIAEALCPFRVTLESDTASARSVLSSSSSVSMASASQVGAPRVSTTIIADHTVRELQILLADAERTLAPSTARKEKIDRFVYGVYLPLLKYGTFALLAGQLVVYFHWVFVVFDWNLVEPTTYFFAYTGVFCSLVYHYYRCGEDEFTWKNIFQRLAIRKAERMYAKGQLDVNGMLQLQRRITLIREELARMSV
ncbi:hypothetical protein JKF63_06251 [Porcisia hertigi]|uniref:Calcium uniporter protein C-terminal domain-containing protein n=1 Tax=Porcisia hertigi TaxID=2761500 RepID=A0A836IX09_9TRYP|nr:hypothetical protein JKF63_06251 [Porcisia hertigi]